MLDSPNPRIAVIGGGPGGLFACWQILKRIHSASITVFESTNRIGGKVQTHTLGGGNLCYEQGVAELYDYSFMGLQEDPLKRLVLDLGLQIVPMWNKDTIADMEGTDDDAKGLPVVMTSRDGLGNTIIHVMRNASDIREQLGKEAAAQIDRFYDLCRKMYSKKDYQSWKVQDDHPWARKSLKDIIDAEVSHPLARKYIEVAVHSDIATEPYRTNGLNGLKNMLMDSPDYMRLYHIVGGNEELPKALGDYLTNKGVQFNLSSPVKKVVKTPKGYSVTYKENQVLDFDYVVICMPVHWISQIEFYPENLAEKIHAYWTRYDNLAHYLRVSIAFRTPFWRKVLLGFYSMLEAGGGVCLYDEDARQNAKHVRESLTEDRCEASLKSPTSNYLQQEHPPGYVLSWLFAGQGAEALASMGQTPEQLYEVCFDSLPGDLPQLARGQILLRADGELDGSVGHFLGSLNAQPGGNPSESVEKRHHLACHLYRVGDDLYDSTLNGTLQSATVMAKLLEAEVKGIDLDRLEQTSNEFMQLQNGMNIGTLATNKKILLRDKPKQYVNKPTSKSKSGKNNPLKYDPSRTASLRRALCSKLRQKFNVLKQRLRKLIVQDDAFGLKGGTFNPFKVHPSYNAAESVLTVAERMAAEGSPGTVEYDWQGSPILVGKNGAPLLNWCNQYGGTTCRVGGEVVLPAGPNIPIVPTAKIAPPVAKPAPKKPTAPSQKALKEAADRAVKTTGSKAPPLAKSVEDGDKAAKDAVKLSSPLSPLDTAAMNYYQSNEGYKSVNDCLRNSKGCTGDVQKASKDMLNAMKKSKLEKPLTTVRGMELPPGTDVMKFFQDKATFSDKGFTSTSAASDVAEQFADVGIDTKTAKVMMKMVIPKGAHALHMPPSKEFGNEAEVILPPNSHYKVHSVTKDANGVWQVEMTYLGFPRAKKSTGNSLVVVNEFLQYEEARHSRFVWDGSHVEAVGEAEEYYVEEHTENYLQQDYWITTLNTQFQFHTDPDKVQAFKQWLKSQLDDIFLGSDTEDIMKSYAEAGFKYGAGRSFDDVNKAKRAMAETSEHDALKFQYQGGKEQFLQSAFGRPVAKEKIELLAERSFEELSGMTDDMANKLRRLLTDGLVQGESPRAIAEDLEEQLELSARRAETIARTECLLGPTLVDTAVVRAVFRRWYVGDVVEIETSKGRKFTTTPNHPMLTENGWVPSGLLKHGDNLICRSRNQDSASAGNPDICRSPTTISEIFDSLNTVGVCERVRTGKPDFHGDGLDGEVEVLRPNRELMIGDFASIAEPLIDNIFTPAGKIRSRCCSLCSRLLPVDKTTCLVCGSESHSCSNEPLLDSVPVSSEGFGDLHNRLTSEVARGNFVGVQIRSQLVGDTAIIPSEPLSLADAPGDSSSSEDLSDLLLVGPDCFSDLPLSQAGEVEFDYVINVRFRPFAGHVYNLETPFGYFTIDTLYTGNTIRAHSEGQLEAMEQLGVDKLGVEVEWSTTGDDKVCEQCSEHEGETYTIEEARGQIPHHPNCFVNPDTGVALDFGWTSLQCVRIGMLVRTHKDRCRKVTAVHRTQAPWGELVYTIIPKGDVIPLEVTGSHPVMSKREWVAAKDLKVGDTLTLLFYKIAGDPDPYTEVPIIEIKTRKLYGDTLYNLSVQEDESYVTAYAPYQGCATSVGAYIVHNCRCAFIPAIPDFDDDDEEDEEETKVRKRSDITTKDKKTTRNELYDPETLQLILNESWFKICPRDERGKCLPKGSTGFVKAPPVVKSVTKVVRTSKVIEQPHEIAGNLITKLRSEGSISSGDARKLNNSLGKMTVKQLTELKKQHGIKASGVKEELVAKVAKELKNKYKEKLHGVKSVGEAGSGEDGGDAKKASGRVASKATGTKPATGDTAKAGSGKSPNLEAAEAIPSTLEDANRKIDRMANLFRKAGKDEQADWMDELKKHVNEVGTDTALKELGTEVKKGHNRLDTQYEGKADDMSAFAEAYLNRHGITPIAPRSPADPKKQLISGQAPKFGPQSRPDPYLAGDFNPKDPTFKDKLVESQHLPGLESSEDINKIMGKPVTHLTPDVMAKLDGKYGKGKWIVKTYGENAFAGNGIFFPQRAAQIPVDARNAIYASGQDLAKYGFSHLRDKAGTVVGIKHMNGDEYKFGTEVYNNKIYGDVRAAADRAAEAAPNEKAAALPFDGKEFMVQPAFDVVGISEADRAKGVTIKYGQEGRVHIVTKKGKASIVPHSTWLKGEGLPVVFENHETRAMAQAAMDAIKKLPKSERNGQIYAPDIVKTSTGYKVVEANPANETGSSGYLSDNPFIIDSYVSHLTRRTPAHVRFIRNLLSTKVKKG